MTLATCLGCGCACDDIRLTVDGGRIVEARNACSLGLEWFGDGRVPARTRSGGRDVPLEDALADAAALCADPARVLVYLAPDLTCEAQREAIAIADALGAALDSVTSATAMPSLLAAQERGRAAATLGEVRNRADVLVFWGVDPAQRYPRYWSRYAPEPHGLYVGGGRQARTVVAVDVGRSHGPADADLRVAIDPAAEVATLTSLAAASAAADGPGAPLRPVLDGARYLVLVADAEGPLPAPRDAGVRGGDPAPSRDAGRADALIALAQARNRGTRCALSLLRAGGNRSGADAVMTAQTGFPAAVDFRRGYPRYRAHDGAAAQRLARGEIDVALVAGSLASVPAELPPLLAGTRRVVIGPRATELAADAAVAVDTGVAGIHEAGTALRMDDVPLPLAAALDGSVAAVDVLRALRLRLAGRQ